MTNIWIAFTKSRPLSGCSIDIDGCEFYFAEAYVPIISAEESLPNLEVIMSKVKNALLENRLELADVSALIRYEEDQWEIHSDSENDVNAFAMLARLSESIVFSGFRSEEIEKLTSYRYSISDLDYD
ncbi:hypothetical protein HCH_01464 [Hahella chejuensis KCTC 2396]|uniref:Uncharacterized protein n=2 Tax=Hahella chejuensis TaxID=158327 RepID=Q2SM02_HAHCH|nr:hypothetical protein HCH_01464 [Hahella chejuensis KCTC 2396]